MSEHLEAQKPSPPSCRRNPRWGDADQQPGRAAVRIHRVKTFVFVPIDFTYAICRSPSPGSRRSFRAEVASDKRRRNVERVVGGNGTFIETLSGSQEHEEAIRHLLPLYECRVAASNCGCCSSTSCVYGIFGTIARRFTHSRVVI